MNQRHCYDMRLPKSVLVLAALACALSLARVADAAPKDAQALKLDEDAINNDYLATKFGDAEKKLKQGLAICGKAACSPNVVAQLHRDLGIIYVVASRADEGKAQFVEALKIDPSTSLPKELTTPEIEQVFSAAKGGPAPAPPAPAAPAPAAPAPAKPPPAAPAPSGSDEIVHTPPAESATMTPVPLYAEVAEGLAFTRVVVKYKPFGAPDWKSVDMKKMKTGYGVEVPCIEIGTTPGDLKYYIQALGAGGEVIATNGTKNNPLKTAIKTELTAEPPHLPGKPAPKACSGPGAADCPPEFPGCKQSKKGAGFSCEADGECQSNQCVNGTCFSDEAPENKCDSDTGCEAGQWCNAGVCASPKKNWIGLALQQDVLFAPSAKDVCLNQSDDTYHCFETNGAPYDGSHALPNASDEVAGGFTQSTTRVMVAYDRVIHESVTVGARIGFAFGGGPVGSDAKPFIPAHVEARATYWFGSDPFIRIGLRPYVVGGLGLAQFDGKVQVKVYNGTSAATAEPFQMEAWKKTGPIFASGGLGAMYALDHNSGINAELRAAALLPKFGIGASLHVGYMMGLF